VQKQAEQRSAVVTVLWFCVVKRLVKKEGGAVEFAKESGGSEGSGRVLFTGGGAIGKGG
jgi:hypothetical protein